MATGTGICYTQSGNVKKYEQGLLSISPDRVKFVDFDNHSAEPFMPYMFTPSSHPPEVSLEEGTVMYVVGLRDPDIDLKNYLTYTPPDGYELVSEDHKYDTGVKKYNVSKYFYCEPFTVYYGTAGKTFNDLGLSASKYFYYKKKDKPIQTTDIRYPVILSINGSMVHCSCQRVTGIPGTDNGNFTLGVNIAFRGYNDSYGSINFEWKMKDGINETKSTSVWSPTYSGSGFTTRSSWEVTNSDGTKTHYIFDLQVR